MQNGEQSTIFNIKIDKIYKDTIRIYFINRYMKYSIT